VENSVYSINYKKSISIVEFRLAKSVLQSKSLQYFNQFLTLFTTNIFIEQVTEARQ